MSPSKGGAAPAGKASTNAAPTEPLQLRIEEKLTAHVGREGDLRSLEVLGMLQMRVREEPGAFAKVKVDVGTITTSRPGIQLQVSL